MDSTGRIYVGAVGDLGYLQANDKGETEFVSLLDKIPAEIRVFEDVWRLFAGPDGVYFQTQVALFRWANGSFRVWKPTGRIFNRAQFANNTLYVGQAGGPLREMYRREQAAFRENVRTPGVADDMWAYLDALLER